MTHTYEQLRDAVQNATGATIEKHTDKDGVFYQVVNPDGSIIGDTFKTKLDKWERIYGTKGK